MAGSEERERDQLLRELGLEGCAVPSGGRSAAEEDLWQRLAQLTEKYDQLYLLSRAVWELLREQTTLQESDLQAKLVVLMQQQQFATKPKADLCPDCDRPLQRIEGKYYKCIYCGYIQEFKSAFDRLL